MGKADVQSPKKRKSFGDETAAKKPKLENGKNEQNKKQFFTPKKQGQQPKGNQQGSPQKSNKKNQNKKGSDDTQKKITPFAGTQQLKKQQQQKQKPKKNQENNEASDKSPKKKRSGRSGRFTSLVAAVRDKEGSKDAELLKQLETKMKDITSRSELSKTAKKKLALLKKLKLIVEEGSKAASEKSQTEKKDSKNAKKDKKNAAAPPKKVPEKAPKAAKAEDDDSEESEEESDEESEEEGVAATQKSDESEDEEEEESDEEDEDSPMGVAQNADSDEDESDSDGEEEDDDDEEDDDEEDSDEEAPAPQGKKTKPVKESKQEVNLSDLKDNDLIKKGQKRYVLFVGNIPYDTRKEDLISHFQKAGEILHVRIPLEKKSNKPRGFAYIEVTNDTTYQKCLSMHHTHLKGRRINVLYTQGGKKKGEDKKKEIKVKNMKLHALRKDGKLAGSVKQSQKRSFRRTKAKAQQQESDNNL